MGKLSLVLSLLYLVQTPSDARACATEYREFGVSALIRDIFSTEEDFDRAILAINDEASSSAIEREELRANVRDLGRALASLYSRASIGDAQGGIQYRYISLQEKYIGEEAGAARANLPQKIRYFRTEAESAPYELTISKSGVVRNGEKLENGWMEIVLTPSGELFGYFGHESASEALEHSSFTSGKPVAFAGRMQLQRGKVTKIENVSSRYQTPEALFSSIYLYLENQGLRAADFNFASMGRLSP